METPYEEVCNTIRRVMLALIVFSMFCLITLNRSDHLLFEPDIVRVAVVDIQIDYLAFLYVAPLILIGLTIYLHIFVSYWRRLRREETAHPPYLFNFGDVPSKALTGFLFYWLPPLLLLSFYAKAEPHPHSPVLLFLTSAMVLAMLYLAVQRREWNSLGLQITILTIVVIATIAVNANALRGIPPFHRTVFLGEAILTNADLAEFDLRNAVLIEANLNGATLHYTDLSGANLKQATFVDAELWHARLINTDLTGANLNGADLQGARLTGAVLRNVKLVKAQLLDSTFDEAKFDGASLCEANFRGANLTAATFKRHANLTRANLSNTTLRRAEFENADLTEANLQRANMAGAQFTVGTRLTGADLSFANLHEANLSGATLVAAILVGTDLSNSDLSAADLTDAQVLLGANLKDANLQFAILQGVNFTGADLTGANLTGADLSNVNVMNPLYELLQAMPEDTSTGESPSSGPCELHPPRAKPEGSVLPAVNLFRALLTNAVLENANLTGAILKEADLSGATLAGTILKDADLRGVRNLDCELLRQAVDWQSAVRDESLACGRPIPDATDVANTPLS